MPKYKISYSGLAYVEADCIEDAMEDYDFASVYEEEQVDDVEEVDEFGMVW